MKTTQDRIKSQQRTVHQDITKILEGIEMKLQMSTSTITTNVSEVLASKAPARILAGLALGALLMTATAMPLNRIHADETTRPLVILSYNQEIKDLQDMESAFPRISPVVHTGYGQQIRDLLGMESQFTSNTRPEAKAAVSGYGQQIRDLLAMESQFTSNTRPEAKVAASGYGQQIRNLLGMESQFTSPTRVVDSGYDQQIADLNS